MDGTERRKTTRKVIHKRGMTMSRCVGDDALFEIKEDGVFLSRVHSFILGAFGGRLHSL